MKDIEIIPLAIKKITQRKIKDEWIKETISNPDQKVKGYGGRLVAQKRIKLGHRFPQISADKYFQIRIISRRSRRT